MRNGAIRKVPSILLSFMAVISFLMLSLPIILSFKMYRQFVWLLLVIKYRTRFKGLLEGGDVIWAIEDISKSIINFLITLETGERPENVVRILNTQLINKCFDNKISSKLICTRHKFLGYSFLLRENNNRNFMTIIKTEENFDKVFLSNFVSSYCNRDMPENNTSLLEILIFDKPMENGHSAILFRIHHSVGDGSALLNYLLENLADQESGLTKVPVRTQNDAKSLIMALSNISSYINRKQQLLPDRNLLHGRELSGDKIISWNTEEEAKTVPMIKEIKKKNPETRFSDVILTAVAASFVDFLGTGTDLTVVVPAIVKKPLPKQLRNSFVMARLKLPLSSKNLPTILESVKNQTRILRESNDYTINYWLLPILSNTLPEILLKPMLNSKYATLIISSLPGPDKISVQGRLLQDIVYWVPHQGTTGVGLSMLTYDNRLQIGLSVDKSLLSNSENAQFIVDNIYKKIEELYQLSQW